MVRRIEMNPHYRHLLPFIERIPSVMESEGTYIYGGRRNLIVKMTAPDGTVLNVKRFCKPCWMNRLVYSTGLRQPKGRRAFTYPERLLAKGIETPEAVAYIEDRNSIGLLGLSWLVSIQCPYPHLLYEMGNATAPVYEPMAAALARFAAHMHSNEVLHLDFSPGNILWDIAQKPESQEKPEAPVAAYRFSVVDINRMRFGTVSMKDGAKSFARLWGPKRFIQLMAEEYARQRGFAPDACTAAVMKARARFWHHYQKKREMEFPLEL